MGLRSTESVRAEQFLQPDCRATARIKHICCCSQTLVCFKTMPCRPMPFLAYLRHKLKGSMFISVPRRCTRSGEHSACKLLLLSGASELCMSMRCGSNCLQRFNASNSRNGALLLLRQHSLSMYTSAAALDIPLTQPQTMCCRAGGVHVVVRMVLARETKLVDVARERLMRHDRPTFAEARPACLSRFITGGCSGNRV